MKKALLFLLIALVSISLKAQDTTNYELKNTIRWNLTPMVVVGSKSLVLGYERLVNPWQSFSINLGYLRMNPFTDEDGEKIQLFDESKQGGIDISADYRFYFKKRNKYSAPDGLYWGPYLAYYGLWSDAKINIMDNSVVKNTANVETHFNMASGGVQLGYQFVIKKRFTVDLILMGPSLTYYNLNANLEFDIEVDADDEIYKEIYEKLKNTNPALANFAKNGEFNASGRLDFLSFGFRYGVQVGYRF